MAPTCRAQWLYRKSYFIVSWWVIVTVMIVSTSYTGLVRIKHPILSILSTKCGQVWFKSWLKYFKIELMQMSRVSTLSGRGHIPLPYHTHPTLAMLPPYEKFLATALNQHDVMWNFMQVSCMVPWYTCHTCFMQGNANILNHAWK